MAIGTPPQSRPAELLAVDRPCSCGRRPGRRTRGRTRGRARRAAPSLGNSSWAGKMPGRLPLVGVRVDLAARRSRGRSGGTCSCSAVKCMAAIRCVGARSVAVERRAERSRRGGEVDDLGPQVLAEALGLGVGAGRRGHPATEQADDDEVERPQVGQLVARAPRGRRSRPACSSRSRSTVRYQLQPDVGVVGAGPHAEVGVAALVARAGAEHPAERSRRGRARPSTAASSRPRADATAAEVLEQRRQRLGVPGTLGAVSLRRGRRSTRRRCSGGRRRRRRRAIGIRSPPITTSWSGKSAGTSAGQ